MSGICGLYHLDKSPADIDCLNEMIRSISLIGNDHQNAWVDKNVALGKTSLFVNPESVYEKKIIKSKFKNYYITADCRIDNRKELYRDLHIKKEFHRTSDTELILGAYEKWKEDAVTKLEGDFAFCIWDVEEKQLFCARDPLGIRPFFYKVTASSFLFSSMIRAIHKTYQVSDWNKDYLADFLYRKGIQSEEDTPYLGVKRLPKGSFLTLKNGTLRITPYWKLDPKKKTIYKNPHHYIEQFQDIFFHSVKARMRSMTNTGVFMSGGLDSTSIYAAAKQYDVEHVYPISCVFDKYKDSDERFYISYVLDKYKEKNYKFVNSDDLWILKNFPHYSISTDEPSKNQLSYGMLAETYRMVLQSNTKVVLNGYAGDQVFGFSPYYISKFIRNFQFLKLCKETSKLAASYNYTFSGALKEFGFSALKGKHEDQTVLLDKYYDEAKERHEMENRIKDPGLKMMYQYIERSQGFGFAQFFSESLGIETRYPFLNVKLIEFIFSIPLDQKIKDAQTKVLLRQSMKGYLPDEVRNRQGKTSNDALIFAGLKNEWPRLFPQLKHLVLEELGIIKGSKFRDKIVEYRHGVLSKGMDYFAALALELWLQKHTYQKEEHNEPFPV
ncbi:asparagine synthase-related protein [Bacillus spizizenii]|nr:asparagine synthase-related protein [Bacillus spizizenii]